MSDVFHYPEDQFVLVGKVAKPHGLRGEVKIHAFSDEAETLLQYSEIILVESSGKLTRPLRIQKSRMQGKTPVLTLEAINDRNSAEALHGMGVLINREDLLEVEDNEYYWYQFYNLPVHTDDGRFIGTVSSIFSNGAQDILVITDGDDEFLVPILDNVIKEHTKEGVVITPPPGLLEINTGAAE